MKICCSIAPTSMSEAFVKIKEASKQSDIVEVRVDGITDLHLPLLLQSSASKNRKPLIITNRIASEGGNFNGSLNEHLAILSEAIAQGVEYVDIEYRCGVPSIKKLMSLSTKTKVIVSHHNFTETPEDIVSIYKKIKKAGAPIIKIATMARDISDCTILFDLLTLARKERQPIIALAMGERGEITRILGGKFNSYLTFGSLDTAEATAPGQLRAQDLIKIFRVPILNSRTKVFGLIGNPVSHSRGKFFHNAVFQKKKLNAVYVNFLVDNLPLFIERFRELAQGFSVTMPYKQAIVPLLDNVQAEIRELNAVNTIIKTKNKLVGTNLDFLAIRACLKKRISLRGKNVLILGTGGTARTMVYTTLREGARVTIVGRDKEKAQSLAREFGCSWIQPDHLHEIATDVVMNATSAGMNASTEIPFAIQSLLHEKMIVFDAVYTPPVTPLVNAALKKNCTVISGLELFKTQATLQSKLFIASL